MSVERPDLLSGAALDLYRDAIAGACWWCDAAADSREHKFKRTDLDRAKVEEPLLWGDMNSNALKPIRSHRKSEVVRFPASLCESCNNRRSQRFDLTYDRYADFVWGNHARLLRSTWLDLTAVFGSDWARSAHDLARYYVKHIGCRMHADGFQPPAEFGAFLDGDVDALPSLHMVTFRDLAGLKWWHRRSGAGEDWFGLSIGPAFGAVSRTTQKLTMYGSVSTVGRIGVMYRWNADSASSDPFYIYPRARLHRRSDLPAA